MSKLKFQHIIDSLASNSVNRIEYYEDEAVREKTYAEVYEDVAAAAGFLRQLGAGPGDRVGIWFENSYRWVVLDLACLAVGAVSVAFHTGRQPLDLRAAVKKFNLKALFTADEVHIADGAGGRSEPLQGVGSAPPYRDVAAWDDDSDFTVVFTSGTTGTPKALGLRVKSVTDFVRNVDDLFTFQREDKVVVFLPLSHFGQRSYVYSAILFGFDLLLVSPTNLFMALRQSRPTIFIAVPFFFEKIYEAVKDAGDNQLRRFLGDRVRLTVTGSAPIRREVLAFYEKHGLILYEGYGTVESGLITLNHPGAYRLGSVGRVFPNKEVKISADGEILVRGEFCWAAGYLDQPDSVNREVFAEDGFVHTGDAGHFDDEGFLYLKGRIKELIVFSNGYKAHPSDIEELLRDDDLIHQVCVFVVSDAVYAVFVPKDHAGRERIEGLVKRANAELPDYARIKGYALSGEEFSTGNGFLTTSLKLNRAKVSEEFIHEVRPAA
jgi:long-chain acyl-CoA synthetase